VAQLPWGHVRVLLDKLATRHERDWYAAATSEFGWSRDVLVHQVETRPAERIGSAPSNFAAALPAPDSELAQARRPSEQGSFVPRAPPQLPSSVSAASVIAPVSISCRR